MRNKLWKQLNPYAFTGPYGEVLWDTVSPLKYRLILDLAKNANLEEIEGFIKFVNDGIDSSIAKLKEINPSTGKNLHTQFLTETTKEIKFCRPLSDRSLEKAFQKQIGFICDYLEDGRFDLSMEALKARDQKQLVYKSRRMNQKTPVSFISLIKLVEHFTNIFCFLRPYYGQGSDDIWITWLPKFKHMQCAYTDKLINSDVKKVNLDSQPEKLLLPSLSHAFENADSAANLIDIIEDATKTMQMDFADRDARIMRLGNVQKVSARTLEPNIINNALHNRRLPSRWWDLFLYNRSGLRLINKEQNVMFYYCAPIDRFWDTFLKIDSVKESLHTGSGLDESASTIECLNSIVSNKIKGDHNFSERLVSLADSYRDASEKLVAPLYQSVFSSFGHQVGHMLRESQIGSISNSEHSWKVSRLHLAWGFGEAARILSNPEGGIPKTWLEAPNGSKKSTISTTCESVHEVVLYFLCGRLASSDFDEVSDRATIQFDIDGKSSIVKIVDLREDIPVALGKIPGLIKSTELSPVTQTICLGLIEIIRNASSEIQKYLQDLSVVESRPYLRFQIIPSYSKSSVTVNVDQVLHDDRAPDGNDYRSETLTNINLFEGTLLQLNDKSVCASSQPTFCNDRQDNFSPFMRSKWTINTGLLYDHPAKIRGEKRA